MNQQEEARQKGFDDGQTTIRCGMSPLPPTEAAALMADWFRSRCYDLDISVAAVAYCDGYADGLEA